MTIESATYQQIFNGNGSNEDFAFNYRVLSEDDMRCVHISTGGVRNILVKDTDFTIDDAGSQSGININFPIAGSAYATLAVGEKLEATRRPAATQPIDFINGGPYDAEDIEDALDRVTTVVSFLRGIVVTLFEDFDIASAAGTVIKVNDAGTSFEVGPTADEVVNAQTYSINAQTSATAAAASETAAAASETAAAASETAAAASETAAAASATAADGSATAAAASAASITGDVTAAEDWANRAEDSLIPASSGGDEVDDYSSKHWNAKASANATAAATSATNAGISETNAAASATAAGTSETNAAASETAAGTSETNAAASATAAAASAAAADITSAGDTVDHLEVVTQAAYDALTPDAKTVYFISG